jgi:hypothetical protein
MNRWRQLTRNRLLDIGVFTVALIIVFQTARMLPTRIHEDDFAYFYLPSKMLLQGENPYSTSLSAAGQPYGFATSERIRTGTNPPLLLWLFAPLARLRIETAFYAWFGVELASLCGVLWLTRHLLGSRFSPRGWRLFYAGVLCMRPLYRHFEYSQAQLVIALMVLAAFAWHRAGKYSAACLSITMAGLLKLFPIVLLPWFIWRSGGDVIRKICRTIAVCVVIMVTIWLTNVALWHEFLTRGMKVITAAAINHTFNCSLPSLVINLGQQAFGFSISSPAGRAWCALGTILGLAAIGACYLLCFAKVHDPMAEFCLLNAAMLLAGVVCWGHYLVILVFPVAVAIAWVLREPTGRRLLFLGITILLLNSVDLGANPGLGSYPALRLWANYAPLGGMCTLIALVVAESGQTGWRAFFAEPPPPTAIDEEPCGE